MTLHQQKIWMNMNLHQRHPQTSAQGNYMVMGMVKRNDGHGHCHGHDYDLVGSDIVGKHNNHY